MFEYSDHKEILKLLAKAQDVETDNRDNVREAKHFIHKKDGQWEPSIINVFSGRPRYTFDKTSPIVDQISGEIDQADFDIRIRPAGGDATKESAMVFDGLIRDIETRSNAQQIYAQAGRSVVESGLGGWMVKQDWIDGDSFEQDLIIEPIHNYEDRVFFDPGAERQDQSDARYVFVLTSVAQDDYDERWPKGSGSSVGQNITDQVYSFKKEDVVVGQIFYKKPTQKTLVRFSDGSVRELTSDLESTMDELRDQGIVEEARRTRKTFKVMSRLFDGQDWLNDEQETVFDLLPVIPAFGNFSISEGKIIYSGIVMKMMDGQRTYNYTRSREIEEIAYSPRQKYWMTEKMAQGQESSLRTLNTNADPVQFYTPDDRQPNGPAYLGGAQVNQGVQQSSLNSSKDMTEAAGLFGLNQGRIDGDSPLSGVAIQSLQNKGDNATIKWFRALEIAINATARVLVKAIPKVYDSNRQARILSEDGSFEMVTVNERVYDNESSTWKTVNDLTKGVYDVTCDVGPAFRNRQQETVKALGEAIANDPTLMEMSRDVLLKNINSPGIDVVAERVRTQMVMAGVIPPEQLTEEEKQKLLAAQQQPKEPDPAEKLAQAEVERVQAETAEVISKSQDRSEKNELELFKLQNDREINELKLILQQSAQNAEQQQKMMMAFMEGQRSIVENLNTQANTLKTIREAIGADAIVGPGNTKAYADQAKIVMDQQEEIE